MIEEGRKWMAEAENRIREYLEEQVKEDHEEKDKGKEKGRKDQVGSRADGSRKG